MDAEALREENRRVAWLRWKGDLLRAVLYQDSSLDLSAARQLVSVFREEVAERFPGKEGTFDLILWPRFDRILRERWGEGLHSQLH